MSVEHPRIGVVRYLNARPLWHELESAGYPALVIDHPSRLADLLAADHLDIALIPSIEYLRGSVRGYRIIPDLAIAARGPVRSVKLFSRVPFDQIHRLALDDGSRTSQALARIWLDNRHGVRPAILEALPVGVSPLESTADAVLLIGDRAMKHPGVDFPHIVDLAQAWVESTDLPFVFALWVTRRDVPLGNWPTILRSCRDSGLARVKEIADRHGPRLDLEIPSVLDYLTNVLSYDLGPPELAGLRLFARKAAALDLAPEGVELVFAQNDQPSAVVDLAGRP